MRRRLDPIIGLAVPFMTLAVGGTLSGAVTTSSALARAEFNREITVQMKDADIVDTFRMLARATDVPFILELENDPSLRVTLSARNTPIRMVLASIEQTHGVEYVASEEGILVRRAGLAPTTERITLGAWPPTAGRAYQLDLLVRDKTARVLYQPRLVVRQGVVGEAKLSLPGPNVTVLDHRRSLAEPRHVNGFEVNICANGETDAGLDLLMEVVTVRAISSNRYIEEHTVLTHTVGEDHGETVLFREKGGHELVLTGWKRRASSGGRPE